MQPTWLFFKLKAMSKIVHNHHLFYQLLQWISIPDFKKGGGWGGGPNHWTVPYLSYICTNGTFGICHFSAANDNMILLHNFTAVIQNSKKKIHLDISILAC